MVTTLYLIRHGETEGSETKRYKGSIDVPLSEKGLKQMKDVAIFLKEHLKQSSASKHLSYLRDIHSNTNTEEQKRRSAKTTPLYSSPCQGEDRRGKTSKFPNCQASRLVAVYTSNLSRAIKSAEAVAEPFGLKPIIIPELRERNFGIWEGMSFTEIKEKYPAEFEAWASNPLRYSPIGGENTSEVRERAIKALDAILSRHKNEHIAIISHGGINRIILCHVLGITLENIFRIEQDYAAVNIIEFWDKYPVVKLINGGR